jgi:hypothetical protein
MRGPHALSNLHIARVFCSAPFESDILWSDCGPWNWSERAIRHNPQFNHCVFAVPAINNPQAVRGNPAALEHVVLHALHSPYDVITVPAPRAVNKDVAG